MIGLRNGIVTLSPYTTKWQKVYLEEKVRLKIVIDQYILDIQHIGSTAIPNMVSKPIIDIAVAVRNFKDAFICIEPIKSLGYEFKGEFGIPKRHFFIKGNPRIFHLHMLEIASQEWRNHIFFRDYLIQHPNKAKEYIELKKNLSHRFQLNREAYSKGKDSFIKKILQITN